MALCTCGGECVRDGSKGGNTQSKHCSGWELAITRSFTIIIYSHSKFWLLSNRPTIYTNMYANTRACTCTYMCAQNSYMNLRIIILVSKVDRLPSHTLSCSPLHSAAFSHSASNCTRSCNSARTVSLHMSIHVAHMDSLTTHKQFLSR